MMGLPFDESSELRQLALAGISAIATVALAYSYVATQGQTAVFLAIIETGILLTLLVAVPVLFREGLVDPN